MLNYALFNFVIAVPSFLFFIFTWYAYFVINSNSFSSLILKRDLLKSRMRNIDFNYNGYNNFFVFLAILAYICLYFFVIRGFEDCYFFNTFFFSNFIFSVFFYNLSLNLFFFFVFIFILKNSQNTNVSLDYVVSIITILFFLPYIFFCNNILIFFFFLELASNLILYNLLGTVSWFSSFSKQVLLKKEVSVSKYFFNVIFFHFWASFFSSVLLIYSIINFYLVFGTTEWFYINFLSGFLFKGLYFNSNLFIYLNLCIFFISFLIKLGVSPFFLFKLEIYKGLPLYNIFFYSFIYFFYFFSIFFLILYYYLPTLLESIYFLLTFFLLIYSILTIFFLFDSALLRNFFAFSSLINSVNLLILII